MEHIDTNDIQNNELRLTENTQSYLLSISKWTFFISIVGLIAITLVILSRLQLLFFPSAMLDRGYMPGYSATSFIITIILLGVVLIPNILLFSSSIALKRAMKENNNQLMETSFSKMKDYWITTLIIMCFIFLTLIFTLMFLTIR